MESKSKNSKIGPRVLSWSKIWFNRNKKIDLETNYIFVTETEADKWPCRSLQSLKTINKNKKWINNWKYVSTIDNQSGSDD